MRPMQSIHRRPRTVYSHSQAVAFEKAGAAAKQEEFFPPRRNVLSGGEIFLFCRVRQLYGGSHRDGEAACVARAAGCLHWAFSLKGVLRQRLHGPEMGIHRAGAPVDGLHGSHGDATERSGDRESIFGIC